jgi:hypothetical protein
MRFAPSFEAAGVAGFGRSFCGSEPSTDEA